MFLRRVRRLFLMLALPFAVVGARLFQLQVISGSPPRDWSDRSSLETRWTDAPRGRILDRNGAELARDEVGFNICVDYLYIHPDGARLEREIKSRLAAEKKGDKRKFPDAPREAREAFLAEVDRYWLRMAELTGKSREQIEAARAAVRKTLDRGRERIRRIRGADFELAEGQQAHAVITGVSREVAMAVAAADPPLPGVKAVPTHSRYYPQGDVAPHLIGTVGPVTERDLKNPLSKDNPAGYSGKDTAGRDGVERSLEAQLRGSRGLVSRPAGRPDAEPVQSVELHAGQDVRLTLDIELQSRIEDLLQQKGAIVVLDVATGGVLAMATWPRYDLNTFRSPAEYAALAADQDNKPFINRAVAPYPPGSTVKPIVGLAALQSGAVHENDCLMCTGKWPEGGNFGCWIYHNSHGGARQHGPLPLTEALKKSCNHYFFHAVQRMGGETLADWYKRFGLGAKTGVGLPGEAAGLVPDEEWLAGRSSRNGKGWTGADARLVSIGQGALLASPLQMADVAASIARGGVRIRPHLNADDQPDRESLGLSREHVRVVQRGMREVVEARDGLAHKIWMSDLRIAGKTGSAQVYVVRDGRAELGDPHCWFIGYADTDTPSIAFSVLLESVPGGSGGTAAAPMAKAVAEICQQMGYVPGGNTRRQRTELAAPQKR